MEWFAGLSDIVKVAVVLVGGALAVVGVWAAVVLAGFFMFGRATKRMR
jgi:hypothetical protein